MTQQWAFCSDSKFSEGNGRPSRRPALGEAVVVLPGRERPGEGWKGQWQSCRASRSPFPGHLIACSAVSASCLWDLVVCQVSRAEAKPKVLMKLLMEIVLAIC